MTKTITFQLKNYTWSFWRNQVQENANSQINCDIILRSTDAIIAAYFISKKH